MRFTGKLSETTRAMSASVNLLRSRSTASSWGNFTETGHYASIIRFLPITRRLSRDTQIGLLTINAARSATLPPELAQERDHLSLDGQVTSPDEPTTGPDYVADTIPVRHAHGPTSTTTNRLIICHRSRPAQVRGTTPGRHVCHGTVR